MSDRASHNSWEINSDYTCASLGSSNTYRCGLILEENYGSARRTRAGLQSQSGDSGAGTKWTTYIDGIVAQSNGSEVLFGTAYDVKVQLDNGSFDFNCYPIEVHKASQYWGTCPVIDR